METCLVIQYVFLLFFFNLSKSFFNSLIISPVGVTTRKKTKPITIGETNLPRRIPNLNHSKLSGVSIFEFNNPNIKNITERIIAQDLMLSPLIKG